MGQLSGFFEDYNENTPHKGLKMKSPRQFIRENLAGLMDQFYRGKSTSKEFLLCCRFVL
jgi:hypothetical protein